MPPLDSAGQGTSFRRHPKLVGNKVFAQRKKLTLYLTENNSYVETFNLVVTTFREKYACKAGKSCPRLVYKTGMKSKINSLKNVGAVLQEPFFFFPKPGSNT